MLSQINVIYFDREESLTNKVRRIDMVGGDNVEIADKIVYESMRSTFFKSRLGIKSTQNRFQLIRFNKSRKSQRRELVKNKDAIADVVDKLDHMDNHLSFKNNIEYE